MTEQQKRQAGLLEKIATLVEDNDLSIAEKVGVLVVLQQTLVLAAIGK